MTMSAPCSTSSSASRTPSTAVGGVLLVGPPVALQRRVDGLPERPEERRCVLRGIGQDRDVGVAGAVERGTDHGDLAVHHPAGPDHVHSGRGLRARHVGVHLEGGVVVDAAVGGEHPAVAVVGELVETQVGHHRQGVTHLGDHIGDGEVEDPVGVEPPAAGGVLGLGDAEQHHAAQAELGRLGDRLGQRAPGVLDDAGHRGDRARLAQALTDEDRQHQLPRLDRRLRDEPAQCRGYAAAGAVALSGRPCAHPLALGRLRRLRDNQNEPPRISSRWPCAGRTASARTAW